MDAPFRNVPSGAVPGGRDRLAVCRTRSRLPCALIGCSRQPVVLQTASRSLPDTPIVKIMRNRGNKHLSSSPVGAGCLPARTWHLPLVLQDSKRITQPSVGKRRWLAAFRTTNCREQLISAHGCLERVLKAANHLRFMARRFIRTRLVLTNQPQPPLLGARFSSSFTLGSNSISKACGLGSAAGWREPMAASKRHAG